MFRYRNEADFTPVQLSNEKKADIQIGDGKSEPELELIDFEDDTVYEDIDQDEEKAVE